MDTAQWPQDIVVKPIEEIIVRNKTCPKAVVLERKNNNNNNNNIIRSGDKKEEGLNCPRCNSSNTKFCYYNNYSLTQPRYFCKTCRRYWTEGGSLRNIPVGGGSRKNKKPSSSNNSSSISNSNSNQKIIHHLSQNPKSIHSQDLNLSSFPPPPPSHQFPSDLSGSATTALSAMELLTGMASNSRGLSCFINPMPFPAPPVVGHVVVPDPGSVYTAGFPDLSHDIHDRRHHQFKSSLGFSLDGYGGGGGVVVPTEGSDGGGRLMQLPLFEDLKEGANGGVEQGNNKEQGGADSTGYWTGMLGGGSW